MKNEKIKLIFMSWGCFLLSVVYSTLKVKNILKTNDSIEFDYAILLFIIAIIYMIISTNILCAGKTRNINNMLLISAMAVSIFAVPKLISLYYFENSGYVNDIVFSNPALIPLMTAIFVMISDYVIMVNKEK